jgi:glycosyltransferase involved in cell wall biosynthesis/GT2 family glycosyltransferase
VLDELVQPATETDLEQIICDWLEQFPAEAPLIVVPVYNAYEDVLECVESIMADKKDDVPFLVVDDASPDDRIKAALEPMTGKRGFFYVKKSQNSGFVGSVNLAFRTGAPHDVVIVNSDLVLPPGWLERLQAAAYYRTNIATATPLTNNGTLLSVPYRNRPVHFIARGMTVQQADRLIQQKSKKLYPIIPTAIGHCAYIRRSALDVVGFFDPAFAPGYGEEVDLSQRMVKAGFLHVVADDTFVFHKGSKSFGNNPEKQNIQQAHERLLADRYPWYHSWIGEVCDSERSTLATSIETARAALEGYRIAIDMTCLREVISGTQVHTIELVSQMLKVEHFAASVTLIVSDSLNLKYTYGLNKIADDVIRTRDVHTLGEPFDLIYRPFQIYSRWDMDLLRIAARRYVIQQLDFIAYSNPSYSEDWEGWAELRYLTQLSLLNADGIIFNSKDVVEDARHKGLLNGEQLTGVGYAAVNHQIMVAKPQPPEQLTKQVADKPFIFVIGANFKHKNRVLALKILKRLLDSYNWDGYLVLAGAAVRTGGSGSEEALEFLQDTGLRSRVIELGAVSEEEKTWLMQKAALVLYPSLYEGFGLVPLEAALAGTPTLTTRSTSLLEVLGNDITYLESLDPDLAVRTVWQMLTDDELRARQVAQLVERSRAFSWESIADRTWKFLYEVLDRPPRATQEVSGTAMLKQLDETRQEFKKLEMWAGQLNNSLVNTHNKPLYRALSRFKLL